MKPASDDKWAIITGASSGIGRALALEFAGGGFNVFLTARSKKELDLAAAECARLHHVQTESFSADLSEPESVDRLIAALAARERRYEVLVNNAGFGIHGSFVSGDIGQTLQLLQLQLTASLKLTLAVLPGMIARRSGRILNIASVYSFSPVPFQSVYSACKAFLYSFSSSLQNELKGTGVRVTVCCPGTTQSKFRARARITEKRKNSGMKAEAVARIAYRETMRGSHLVIPGFLNRLYVLVVRLLPPQTVPGVVRFINRHRVQGQP